METDRWEWGSTSKMRVTREVGAVHLVSDEPSSIPDQLARPSLPMRLKLKAEKHGCLHACHTDDKPTVSQDAYVVVSHLRSAPLHPLP